MKGVSFTSRLRRWLNNIPIQDPIERRIASLLQAILIGLIVIIILATLVNVMNSTHSVQEKLIGMRGNLLGFLVIALPLSLLRRGYFRASALIVIIVLLITPTLAITVAFDLLNSGGILFQFTLAIMLAGLLVNRRALMLTFGLSAAVVVGSAAFRGQNPTAEMQISANFILFNGLIALFIDRFGVTLRTALTDALAREHELQSEMAERKRAEMQIQQQLQRLNSLWAIDKAISSSFDIQVTLDIILQQVLSQLRVDTAAILLLNPQVQTVEYAASRGFRSNALQHTQLQLNEGYASRAVYERKTIYIPAFLERDSKLAKILRSEKEDFIDYYGTPLISKDGIKGVLEIYHRSTLHADPEWLDFLETLAGQAAIAIDNAQLFEGLQRANAELEQRVAQRTEELKKTNIELEHANRTKDEFLATMSHELRTPLNSILGLSETLLEQRRDPLSVYQQKSLQTIASSGEHLLELINDILDLSKIEAGKFDYYPQMLGVDDLCRSSLAFVKEQATRKSITLNYKDQQAVFKIYADPRRLKQIIVNLLTNAVKFTPDHGQVTLQVNSDVEQGRIQFSVIDTGIGIAPKDMQKLFQPFVQVDSRLTREYEGTGLGLALVQKLTDLQGGSVTVESEVDKGSRFTINLPIVKAMLDQQTVIRSGDELPIGEQAESSPLIPEPANRGIILLAEDNVANVLTIGDYLESHKYQVVVAHDGLSAIEQAKAIQPNIILMDIQMPVMDGLEAIRQLRQDARFAATPIIALTALAMSDDRERCLEAGANEYMSKPVSLKSLVKTIEDLLQHENK